MSDPPLAEAVRRPVQNTVASLPPEADRLYISTSKRAAWRSLPPEMEMSHFFALPVSFRSDPPEATILQVSAVTSPLKSDPPLQFTSN